MLLTCWHKLSLPTTLPPPSASDADGDPLTASRASGPSNGTLTLNSDGSFTYTPDAGYVGTDSFTYTASDGILSSSPATVTINVTDNAPVANDDSYSVLHDQELDVDASTGVLANDTDADGDSLTASLASGTSHGTVQLAGDGSFMYMPTAGYVGSDSFTYTASDGILTSSPATVTLDVTDQAPTAGNLSYDLPENSTENVPAANGLLSAASDADGDPLTVSSWTQPSDGTLAVSSNGSFTYTPNTDYTGSDGFQYTVSDGALTATATVTLNIHSTDTAPVANNDSYSVLHDQELDVAASGVLANDTDADGDSLTASLVSDPSDGTLTFNSDGSFTYMPNAGWIGTDSFTYKAYDGQLYSNVATVTISVTDQAPVAVDDSYDVESNNEFDADYYDGVLANDTDADGDSLTATLVNGPSNGTLDFNSDGTFAYVPNQNFTGTDTFTYTASDSVLTSNTATVTLTVTASPPVAEDDSYDVEQNNTLNMPADGVLANDYDPDNLPITAVNATQPSHGSVTVNSDGSFSYTPDSDYVGSDSFTYEASDGTLTSDPATVTITVTSSDTAPTAGNLSYSVDENSSLSTDNSSGVLSAASDADGDPLTAVLVSNPSDGTLDFNSDGSFTYTPNTNYYGSDSFTYKAFDGTLYSNVATATLTVNEDVPSAVNDSYSVLASGATSVSSDNGVLANDSDSEGTALTAVVESQPADGSLTLDSDGSFTYTPNSNFTGSDSFTYEAYNGLNYSTPATVNLTSGPVASDQSYSVTHDQTLTVDASDGLLTGATDSDDDSLTAALATGPSDGTVTVNSDGSFTYVPNTHYVGTDSFTFTVSDGTNTSTPATATIDVTNAVPTANDQTLDTPENTALNVNAANGVLASSSDADGDALTAQLVSGPSDGTIELGSGGNFTYTPNTGFHGTDSFTYDVSDGVSTSNVATVTITVNQVDSENTPNSVYSAVATADNSSEVLVADKGLNQVDVFSVDSSGNLSSAPVETYAVGLTPVGLAVGNFNNDIYDDVAVANSGDNTVSILLGAAGNTFTTGTTLTGFNDPVAVVAGDFGNGQEDLAVVNNGNNTVSILIGNGNGTFTLYGTLTTGNAPTSIAAADFNNDGNLDLVVTNSADNTVSVFLGNGNGTFQAALTDAVGTTPMSVTTGYFVVGNDNADIAVANSGSNSVSVLLGNGNGTFQPAVSYAVGSSPIAIAATDFLSDGSNDDQYGTSDLAILNSGDGTESRLWGVGDGTFIPLSTIPVGSNPVGMALGSFDNSGVAGQALIFNNPILPALCLIPGAAIAAKQEAPSISLSSNGNTLATLFLRNGNAAQWLVIVWDLTGPGVKYTIQAGAGNPGVVTSIALSPDASTLVLKSPTSLTLITIKTGAMFKILTKQANLNDPMAISSDGKTLAAVVGKDIGLFKMSNGALIRTITTNLPGINSVALTPDGKTLIAGGNNGMVQLFNVANGNPIGKPIDLSQKDGFYVQSLAVSSDSKYLVVAINPGSTSKSNKAKLVMYDISNPNMPKQVWLSPIGANSAISAVAITPDAKTVVLGYSIGGVDKFLGAAVFNGALVFNPIQLNSSAQSIAISPKSNIYMIGQFDGHVTTWNAKPLPPAQIKPTLE